MRLLDLFCKAGGCSVGYHRAGFEVEGVDIEPQPNYPYKFYQMDAIEFLNTQDLSKYDVIHASPPCQKYSKISIQWRNKGKQYPDLIEPVRELLIKSGKPFVIENVEGSPLTNCIMLCGTMFDLKVYRHRYFESNYFLWSPCHFPHYDNSPSAGHGLSPKGFISVCGNGGVKGFAKGELVKYWSMAMGIDWMTKKELAQAISPAYTEYIGNQLIQQLKKQDRK